MQRCFLLKLFPSGLELLKDSPKAIQVINLWSFIYADQKLTNPVQKFTNGCLIKSHRATTTLKREKNKLKRKATKRRVLAYCL